MFARTWEFESPLRHHSNINELEECNNSCSSFLFLVYLICPHYAPTFWEFGNLTVPPPSSIWSAIIFRESADSFPLSSNCLVSTVSMLMLFAAYSFIAIALAMAFFVACLFPPSPLIIDIRQKFPRALCKKWVLLGHQAVRLLASPYFGTYRWNKNCGKMENSCLYSTTTNPLQVTYA